MRKFFVPVLIIVAVAVIVGSVVINHLLPYAFVNVKTLQFGGEEDWTPVSSWWLDYPKGYLQELRTEFGLDEAVKDCRTDIERVRAITDWVHNLWEHDGKNTPAESHPLFILREVAKGERFRCVEYGVVITGCLQALGVQTRTLGLKMKDMETRATGAGHVVTEAYLPNLKKWVFIDGQYNAIPFLDGTPLNAVELQAAIADKSPLLSFPGISGNESVYKKWIIPYLYYFDVSTPIGERIMLAPLGAPKPTVFQQKWPLDVDIFTHSVQHFYSHPLQYGI